MAETRAGEGQPPSPTSAPAAGGGSAERGHFRRAARWGWPELAFWALALAAFFAFPLRLPMLTEIVILGLFALSLDLLLGYAGIVSLGHAAYFGLGAYTAGILARAGYADPTLGLAAACAASAAFGLATSFLVLRGSDLTRIMVTLGIAMMLYEAANKASGLTGGADGLQGVAMAPVLGLFEFDLYGRTGYLYALCVTFALFVLARRVVNAPFGLALRGGRSNSRRMAALGAPVGRRLVAVYTLAAAYAGIAGALLAQTTQFVSLDVLAFHRSAEALLVLVIGGTGLLYGAFVGAAVFKVGQEWLAGITAQYWQFWLGFALVALVVFARGGIMGYLRPAYRRLARRGGRDK